MLQLAGALEEPDTVTFAKGTGSTIPDLPIAVQLYAAHAGIGNQVLRRNESAAVFFWTQGIDKA